MPKDEKNPFGLKIDLDPENEKITVIVRKRDGENFVDVETEDFKIEDVAEELRPNVGCYGLSKILQDRTSEVKAGPDKMAAMREVMSQLTAGQWEKERVVGAPTVSAEVEALAKLKGITIPDAQRALKKYAADVREKILANPQVVELAAAIRKEREGAEAVSLDDMVAAA